MNQICIFLYDMMTAVCTTYHMVNSRLIYCSSTVHERSTVSSPPSMDGWLGGGEGKVSSPGFSGILNRGERKGGEWKRIRRVLLLLS